MAYIVFDNRKYRIHRDYPTVTISHAGQFRLNKVAAAQIVEWKKVIILWDGDARRVRLERRDDHPQAFTLSVHPKQCGAWFSPRSFLSFIGWKPELSASIQMEMVGDGFEFDIPKANPAG